MDVTDVSTQQQKNRLGSALGNLGTGLMNWESFREYVKRKKKMRGKSWEEKQGPRCVNDVTVISYELYLLFLSSSLSLRNAKPEEVMVDPDRRAWGILWGGSRVRCVLWLICKTQSRHFHWLSGGMFYPRKHVVWLQRNTSLSLGLLLMSQVLFFVAFPQKHQLSVNSQIFCFTIFSVG